MDQVLTYLLKMGIPAEVATQVAAKFASAQNMAAQQQLVAQRDAMMRQQTGMVVTDREAQDWQAAQARRTRDVHAQGLRALTGKAVTDQELADYEGAGPRINLDVTDVRSVPSPAQLVSQRDATMNAARTHRRFTPVEHMLVEKYKLPPEKAIALAARLNAGHPLVQEADHDQRVKLQHAANAQLDWLGTSRKNAQKFTTMHDAVDQSGPGGLGAFSPDDRQWYDDVLAIHRQKLNDLANQAYPTGQR